MTVRNLVAVALVWALSLVGVAVWAQGTPPPSSEWRQITTTQVPPGAVGEVISGADIGFRVASRGAKPGQVTGRLVVKVNGQWTDAIFDVGITR